MAEQRVTHVESSAAQRGSRMKCSASFDGFPVGPLADDLAARDVTHRATFVKCGRACPADASVRASG
jgi:hypothetical protein